MIVNRALMIKAIVLASPAAIITKPGMIPKIKVRQNNPQPINSRSFIRPVVSAHPSDNASITPLSGCSTKIKSIGMILIIYINTKI